MNCPPKWALGQVLLNCREQVLSNYFGLCKMSLRIACNVEAWRSAGNSIPSARLTAVDFYLQFQVTINRSIEIRLLEPLLAQ
jgi:hypothetical protein